MSIEHLHLKCINPTVPTVYGEELSYLESLGKVQLKVNELIDLIETIKPDELRAEMSQLREYVNNEIEKNKSDINTALENNLTYVMALLDSTIEQIDESLRTTTNNINVRFKQVLQELYYAIDNLSANIRCINVVKGQNDDISSSVRALYDTTRLTGLTALQYDELLYDARTYDSFGLSAQTYDLYALLKIHPYFKGYYLTGRYLQSTKAFNFSYTHNKLTATEPRVVNIVGNADTVTVANRVYFVLATIAGFKETLLDVDSDPIKCGYMFYGDDEIELFIRASGTWDRQLITLTEPKSGYSLINLSLPIKFIERT